MAKEIFCSFGVDVDAVAGWLGSYGGEDSPDDISRGLFAGEVGSPRLVRLFERFGIKTTWFIPGHSIETFPEQMQAVVEAGHEVGIHGYSHENPIGDTWTKIDYAKQPQDWMHPLVRGQETDLIEIPASWHLDDLPPMMFIKKAPNSHGFVNPRDIEVVGHFGACPS